MCFARVMPGQLIYRDINSYTFGFQIKFDEFNKNKKKYCVSLSFMTQGEKGNYDYIYKEGIVLSYFVSNIPQIKSKSRNRKWLHG